MALTATTPRITNKAVEQSIRSITKPHVNRLAQTHFVNVNTLRELSS